MCDDRLSFNQIVFVNISGWLFDSTQSWDAVFILFAAHYVGGALLWAMLASDQPLKLDGEAAYTSVDCISDDDDDDDGGSRGGGVRGKEDGGYGFTKGSSTLATTTASTTPIVVATALATTDNQFSVSP